MERDEKREMNGVEKVLRRPQAIYGKGQNIFVPSGDRFENIKFQTYSCVGVILNKFVPLLWSMTSFDESLPKLLLHIKYYYSIIKGRNFSACA